MTAWYLEVLDEDGRVRERRRLDGPAALGRGYGNDVILDDPAVSPAHARLAPGPDGWTVEDLGGLGGVRLSSGGATPRAALSDGDSFRLGRTTLRLRSSDFVVPPAVAPEDVPGRAAWDGPAGASAAWALFLALFLARDHFREFEETDAARLAAGRILSVAGVILAGLAWTGLCALVSRLASGRRAFWSHAAVAGAGALALAVVSSFVGWFSFAWGTGAALWWAATGAVLAAQAAAHLRRGMAPGLRRRGSAAALVVALFWGSCGAVAYFQARRFSPSPKFDDAVRPAWARLAPARPPSAWRPRFAKIRARAESAIDRRKES